MWLPDAAMHCNVNITICITVICIFLHILTLSPSLFREDEEGVDGDLVEQGLQSHAGNDSPLSVDSLSGIYLGFSEKEKKGGSEDREEGSSYVVEDDLKIEDEEAVESLKRPAEKISRPHLLAHFFQRPKKRRSRPRVVDDEEEKEEATSCFRLFRRTLNISEYDGWFVKRLTCW